MPFPKKGIAKPEPEKAAPNLGGETTILTCFFHKKSYILSPSTTPPPPPNHLRPKNPWLSPPFFLSFYSFFAKWGALRSFYYCECFFTTLVRV